MCKIMIMGHSRWLDGIAESSEMSGTKCLIKGEDLSDTYWASAMFRYKSLAYSLPVMATDRISGGLGKSCGCLASRLHSLARYYG
jgi:hypothetical protein